MPQIYQLEFTSPPYSWNGFNRYHVCIYIHVYTYFCIFSYHKTVAFSDTYTDGILVKFTQPSFQRYSFFLVVVGFELRALCLARKALYHLSYSSRL
jgi:hypothetical protein